MNYYRRYVGDYLRDTARLTLLEHGAYCMLLDYYYAEEKPISLDLDEVCRMIRAITLPERAAVEKVLGIYFRKGADAFHHKRANHEIQVSQKARVNGAKGGRPVTGELTGFETEIGTIYTTGELAGSGHPPTTIHQPPTSRQPTAKEQGAKGSRLPAAWQPDEKLKAQMALERPDLDLNKTLEKFRDYWAGVPGARGRKLDWPATFRNWVRDEKLGRIERKQEWWATDDGIRAKAAEVGLTIRRGESWAQLKGRINAILEGRA